AERARRDARQGAGPAPLAARDPRRHRRLQAGLRGQEAWAPENRRIGLPKATRGLGGGRRGPDYPEAPEDLLSAPHPARSLRHFGSIDKSKEAVLKENLHQMREAISRYYADKGRYPESLDSLATDKYLRRVPVDPITESTTTWMIVQPEDQTKGGVYDVKSG